MGDRAKIAPNIDWDKPGAAEAWQNYLSTGDASKLPTKTKPMATKTPKDTSVQDKQKKISALKGKLSALKDEEKGLQVYMHPIASQQRKGAIQMERQHLESQLQALGSSGGESGGTDGTTTAKLPAGWSIKKVGE